MSLQDTTRQRALLDALAAYVERSAAIGALVVVGSFAKGSADALSDLDLFLVAHDGQFDRAWNHRHELRVTGALVHWDQLDRDRAEVASHRWLSPDLVLVETVMASPRGGARLAPPYKIVTGDADLVRSVPSRPPVDPSEMTDRDAHPVEVAYDAFKRAIRDARDGHPAG